MSSKIEDEAPRSKRRRRNRRARHKPQQSLAGRLTYEVSESDPRLFEVGLETSVQEGTISFHHGGRWLANMLVGPMASVSADGVLTLGADCGTNAEALRVVVSYMYTGTLELQASTTFDVLSATNFLELDVAKGLCVSFLCDSLRPETASSTMAAGAHYSSAELENGARGFVAEHF